VAGKSDAIFFKDLGRFAVPLCMYVSGADFRPRRLGLSRPTADFPSCVYPLHMVAERPYSQCADQPSRGPPTSGGSANSR